MSRVRTVDVMSRILSYRYRSHFWSQVTALSLALGVVSLIGVEPMWAQEQQIRTLSVTGQGVVSIPTSLAEVRLGVEVQGKTAQEVQQEVAKRSQSVVELLRSRNVEKLETTGIQLNPIYTTQNDRTVITGYSAANLVSFRIPTERSGTLLDEAVNAGATRIDGIRFIATDEAIAQAQEQALIEATRDAQRQADVVLNSLNLARREIVRIQVNAATPYPQPFPLFREAAVADASMPVIGGEQQIQGSVTLEIQY